MRNFILFIFIVICHTTTFGQSTKKILGKIVSSTRDLEGITVLNKNTDNWVETDKGGYFNIDISENDTLQFSALHMMATDYVIKSQDLTKAMLFIPMDVSENILKEIVIDRRVNSETLGFGKPLTYTASERNLMTATSSGGGIIAVDALINAISGRKKMLRKVVALETENIRVEKFIQKFDAKYYTDYLKIPPPYIMAFGYYVINDSEVQKAVSGFNKNYIDFVMSKKAVEFNNRLSKSAKNE